MITIQGNLPTLMGNLLGSTTGKTMGDDRRIFSLETNSDRLCNARSSAINTISAKLNGFSMI